MTSRNDCTEIVVWTPDSYPTWFLRFSVEQATVSHPDRNWRKSFRAEVIFVTFSFFFDAIDGTYRVAGLMVSEVTDILS